VSVPRVGPCTLFIQMQVTEHYLCRVAPFGNPRITASGSSPGLIAANRVLHRLWAPRHPPCTLSSLTATLPSLWRVGPVAAFAARGPDAFSRRYPLSTLSKSNPEGSAFLRPPRQHAPLYQSHPDCQIIFTPDAVKRSVQFRRPLPMAIWPPAATPPPPPRQPPRLGRLRGPAGRLKYSRN